jgi:hypothetical protein
MLAGTPPGASPADATKAWRPAAHPFPEHVMANRWQGAIRALIYVIQFEDDPTQSQAVDHALRVVVARGALDLTPIEYRDAIVSALASNELVSELILQDHSEETLRRYLELVLERL